MLEVNRRRLRARVHPDGSRVERLIVLGLNLKAVAGKGEAMSNNVIGCFAVLFRFCCSPTPLQLLLGLRGGLREGESEPGPEDQQAHRRGQLVHTTSPIYDEDGRRPSPDLQASKRNGTTPALRNSPQ